MTVALPEQSTVALDNIATLDDAMAVCEQLAQSKLVPKRLQNEPASILLIYLNGRELGLSFAQSLRTIYAPGEGQVAMRVSLMLAKLHDAGHEYRWEFGGEGRDYGCTFWIKRKGAANESHAKFTLTDAIGARLLKEAPDGNLVAFSPSNAPMPWMLYHDDMLFARAATRATTRACPEVLLGFGVIEATDPQPETELQPQAAANGGPPASPPDSTDQGVSGPGETVAEELAALDAQGKSHAPEPAAGEAGITETASPGTAQQIDQDAPGALPEAMAKKVRQLFTQLGWNPRGHRVQIIEACTAFCRRNITSASDLTPTEAGELIAALTVITRSSEPTVTLEENVQMWRSAWREADPEGYGKALPE